MIQVFKDILKAEQLGLRGQILSPSSLVIPNTVLIRICLPLLDYMVLCVDDFRYVLVRSLETVLFWSNRLIRRSVNLLGHRRG